VKTDSRLVFPHAPSPMMTNFLEVDCQSDITHNHMSADMPYLLITC
jgi:hypothetical protein